MTLAGWGAVQAQPAGARAVKVVQLLDVSPDQQELSRDHAGGLQLALALHNRARAGRPLALDTVELRNADELPKRMAQLRADEDVVALLGTCGERLALAAVPAARHAGLEVAHIGPWLGDTRFDGQAEVLPLFASREQQLRHALRSLDAMGVADIGLVFASASDRAALSDSAMAAGRRIGVRLQSIGGHGEDVATVAGSLTAQAPPVLLFLGGTVELARFAKALSRRRLQRYLVSLSDVDPATLLQLGAARTVPLILTQVVPNPATSALPVVRDYREGLKLLFDEAPSPTGLAGFLAGRYVAQLLSRMEGPVTRAAVLQRARQRPALDLGGFALSFAGGGRGSGYVTQTMLTPDGRLIG